MAAIILAWSTPRAQSYKHTREKREAVRQGRGNCRAIQRAFSLTFNIQTNEQVHSHDLKLVVLIRSTLNILLMVVCQHIPEMSCAKWLSVKLRPVISLLLKVE